MEHNLVQVFKQLPACKKIVVCVSGGLDSMALLHGLCAVKKQFQLNLSVLHVHHGYGPETAQNEYRDKALSLVKRTSEELGLRFYDNTEEQRFVESNKKLGLSSEADYRDYREACMQELSESLSDPFFAFAQHRQDLLETRLIQLIRGASLDGFLSLRLLHGFKIRPLLNLNKAELASYVYEKQIEHLQDPSNLDTTYLRNWLRHEWLPELEQRRGGSVSTLSQSLQNLAEELTSRSKDWAEVWVKVYNAERRSLSLSRLWLLSSFEQRKCIAELLKLNNWHNYSRNQLFEALKRLDTPQKIHKFQLMSFMWTVRDDELIITKN